MKLPTDVVRMYKEIHGWVGIVSGLALFVAFFAGAITMFEGPLQQWASPPSRLAPAPSLEHMPKLIGKVLAAHPEAAKGYDVNLLIDAGHPARLIWKSGDPEDIQHGGGTTHYASLAHDDQLQIETRGPSPVAQFIDTLHRQVGMPLDHAIAEPIMGAVALLYFVALVSGVVVLLPSLIKDLFALRFSANVKRMWLDLHNLLGLFSLPFHVIMALTAVVFAFHDPFYIAQGVAVGASTPQRPAVTAGPSHNAPSPVALSPAAVVERLKGELPDFHPLMLSYGQGPGGRSMIRATGGDAQYGIRNPLSGVVTMDPASGRIMSIDFMPGRQDGWSTAVTSFFSLHYGSFGGAPVRWSYFLLGMAGAFLFYTGNLLWVESRRKRERKAGRVEQTRATRVLGSLTVGVPLGCIAGIALTIAAAPVLGDRATTGAHSLIYYGAFLLFTGWALWRGAARAGSELAMVAALATFTIPVASLLVRREWPSQPLFLVVDGIALGLAGLLFMAARSARSRAVAGTRDSIWSEADASAPAKAMTPGG